MASSSNSLQPKRTTRLIYGKRIGRGARLRLGCSATIFDSSRQKIFLTQRRDNALWCLPGGGMDPGENAAETCVREMREETGLQVVVKRLLGIYSSPDVIVEYPDGNHWQIVALNFEVEIASGEPALSDEVSAFGWFALDEIDSLNLMQHHYQRIVDAFANQSGAFVR